MGLLSRFAALVLIVAGMVTAGSSAPAAAHQDGCHAAHSCPSDANPPTYICGDTGNYTYCPGLSGSVSTTGSTTTSISSVVSAYVRWSVAVNPGSATYQWYRSGVAIPGAVTTSYTVTLDDIGQTLVLTATAVDGRGQSAVASSPAFVPNYPALPTGSAALTTTSATVGTTVTAAVTWSRTASAVYQWVRGATPIAGATATTYTVTADDLGQPLKLLATVTEYGRSVSIASPTITPIADAELTLTTRPKIRAGKKATLRGTLSTVAGPSGRVVTIKAWQKVGHYWTLRNSMTKAVSSTGNFTAKQPIARSRKGTWRFKAFYVGTAGVRSAQSPFVSTVSR